MGPVEMLKFALICMDSLAWPLIALAYPLFASIRAVESGSKYHMTKLVKYWTLFAFICLFEFAFAKIVEWIPWWPRIRLVVVLWLTLPCFDGASYAYLTLVAVAEMLYKRPRTREMVDKCIKRNGSKNLVADKECNDDHRDVQFTEAEINAAAEAATILLKQVNETFETKSIKQNGETQAAAEAESIQLNQDNGILRLPPPALEKQEWRCDLCNVKTTSENNLNAHLKGKMHKSNCESLKAIKLNAKDARPSKPKRHDNADAAPSKPKKHDNTDAAPSKPKKHESTEATNPIYKHHCHVCNVKMRNDISLASHLKGKRHVSNIQNMAKLFSLTNLN